MSSYDELVAKDGTGTNEYDALINDDTERQRLRASMFSAKQQNPDQYGEAKQIERTTGVPASVGARNLGEVKLKADLNEYDKLLRTSPVLARQLQNTDFASMSHDDVENLSQTEYLLRSQESGQFAGGQIGGPAFRRYELARPVTGPTPSISSVVSGIYNSLGQATKRAELGMQQQGADLWGDKRLSADLTRARKQIDLEESVSTPDFDSATAAGIYSGGVSTMQQIPAILAALRGGAPMGLAMFWAQTEPQAYGKYRARGGSPGEALLGAQAEASTEVLTEMLPMGFLVSKFGKVGAGQFLAGLLAREVPSEQLNTLVSDAIDTSIANPEKTWDQYIAERPGAAYQTLLATLVQSGVMGGGHAAVRYFAHGQDEAKHSEDTNKALTLLTELSKASKLRERDPQSFAEFVDAAAADGPVQHVYVDARTFAQAAGEQLPEILAASPSATAQLKEAMQTGGDLVIPLGEYAAGLGASDYNQVLLPHLRTSAEAMSMEESKTFMQTQAEDFKRQAEKILQQQEFDGAFKTSAATVEKELLAQLKVANRFTDDVNGNYAKLMAAFYTVQAARLGITPEELYVKYPLEIRAEGVPRDNVMEQRQHEDRLIEERMGALLSNVDAAEQKYNAFPESQGGKVLDVDIARELSPDYQRDRTRSSAVQVPASQFVKQLFVRRLASFTRPRVLFMAGGTGSGKSTAVSVPAVKAAHDAADIVRDTTLQGYEGAKVSIDQALAAGGTVNIAFVIRDPVESLVAGALPRAMMQERAFGSGRSVELDKFVASHVGAMQTVFRLADEYAGNPDVHFAFVDNTHGRGNAKEVTLAEAKGIVYTDIGPKVRAALEHEHATGKISDAVYAGFKHREDVTGGAQGAGGVAGQPGQEPGGQSQQQREGDAAAQVAPAGPVFAQDTIDNATGQVLPNPPFYSPLQRQIAAVKVNVAPAAQWKTLIASLAQKGVKKDEIEWSGILDWLDAVSGEQAIAAARKLTIGDYMAAHNIDMATKALTGDERVMVGDRELYQYFHDKSDSVVRIVANAILASRANNRDDSGVDWRAAINYAHALRADEAADLLRQLQATDNNDAGGRVSYAPTTSSTPIMVGNTSLDEWASATSPTARKIATDALLKARSQARPDQPTNWREAKLEALTHAMQFPVDTPVAVNLIESIKQLDEQGNVQLTFGRDERTLYIGGEPFDQMYRDQPAEVRAVALKALLANQNPTDAPQSFDWSSARVYARADRYYGEQASSLIANVEHDIEQAGVEWKIAENRPTAPSTALTTFPEAQVWLAERIKEAEATAQKRITKQAVLDYLASEKGGVRVETKILGAPESEQEGAAQPAPELPAGDVPKGYLVFMDDRDTEAPTPLIRVVTPRGATAVFDQTAAAETWLSEQVRIDGPSYPDNNDYEITRNDDGNLWVVKDPNGDEIGQFKSWGRAVRQADRHDEWINSSGEPSDEAVEERAREMFNNDLPEIARDYASNSEYANQSFYVAFRPPNYTVAKVEGGTGVLDMFTGRDAPDHWRVIEVQYTQDMPSDDDVVDTDRGNSLTNAGMPLDEDHFHELYDPDTKEPVGPEFATEAEARAWAATNTFHDNQTGHGPQWIVYDREMIGSRAEPDEDNAIAVEEDFRDATTAAERERESRYESEVDSYSNDMADELFDSDSDHYMRRARDELERDYAPYEPNTDVVEQPTGGEDVSTQADNPLRLMHRGSYQSDGGTNYREIVIGVPKIEKYDEHDSTHFGHVFQGRTVAWARVKERVDGDGKKVLVIEEVQSKRAQAGRDEGFKRRPGEAAVIVNEAALQAEAEALAAERDALIAKYEARGLAGGDLHRLDSINSRLADISRERSRDDGSVPSAPFITDTKAWASLTMKRLIRYAVERGLDRVTWTQGPQQVYRYENALRKAVDKIEWKKEGDGIHINVLSGGDTKLNEKMDPKRLRLVVGPAMAQDIINNPEQSGEVFGSRLRIDDQGMVGFYGDEHGLNLQGKPSVLTSVTNDVLKKLGGDKVKQMPVTLTENDKTYEGAPGFDITDKMRKAALEGQPLMQGSRGQISFANDMRSRPSVLTLLQNADLSTFLHEMGHFQLEVLADIASQPGAPAEVVNDLNKLLAWFGVPDLATWRSMTLEEKRPYHEQFARGFESYLFEGRAPAMELAGIFARFRAWLINVYKQITALNVQLTPEVRGVMDRLIATTEEIKAAEAIRNFEPLFKSAEEAGMTAEEWKSYHDLALEATQTAVNLLQSRSLRDMQWLQNARSRILSKLQKDAAGKRKAVEREVTDEVRTQPVYAAQRFLRNGELANVDRSNAERKALEAIAGQPTKLSLPALKAMYGEGPAAPWRYLPVGKNGLAATDGLHPDTIAELFGFSSGDELVRKMLDAQPESAVIEGMTDQRMLERYGDLSSPEAIERAANEAIHNDVRARFVATELRMLAKATGQQKVLTKAAREFAATIVARKRLRDIHPSQYEAAEARSSKAAERAMLKKKLAEAAVEKRNQLVNHFAARSAYAAQDEIAKALRYLKRVGDSKTVDPEYRDQIEKLLDRFDLRRTPAAEGQKRASLTEWIASEREKGNEPVISPELENEALRKPYQDMTLEEFRGLMDAVRNIEHLGRLKHKLLTARDAREFKARVDEAAAAIHANAKRTVPEKLERNSWTERMKDGAAEFFAMHRKFAAMIRELDGYKDGGVLWELFSRPMNEAGAKEAVMRERATERLSALFEPILAEGKLKEKLYIAAINNSLSREGRIMVALNAGNEGNLQRLMDGDHWSPAQVRAVIDTLTKPEMDFVQGVWDFIAEYRDAIGAQQQRITGVDPEWIQPRALETRHGTYKGGYLPVKYDTTRSTRSLSDEAASAIMDQWRGARGQAKTRDSFTKERSDKVVDRALRKDFGVITQHVTEVTHRLAWQEYLMDAMRLLRAKPIDSAIREHYGHQTLEAMRDAVTDIAAGEMPAQNAFERAVNFLRIGTTIAGLGWRITTSLLQPLGLTQSMVRIGPKWVARGLVDFIGDAARMENAAKKIYEKSEFMRNRGKTLQREISEIQNKVEGRSSALTASYFYLIQKLQLVADIPTWLGQYHKAIDSGADEGTAVAQADQAVLDAQGGGQLKDLAAIQRGGPLLKLFTNFYSFFNTTYQLTQEAVGKTEFKNPLSVGRLAVDMLLLYTVPAVLGTLLKAALHSGDDGEEKKLIRQLIADQLSYLFGTVVGLREIAGAGQAAFGLPGDYQGPASVRLFADLARLGKQAGQGEVDEALLKAANNVGGVLFHYPSGQVNATLDGIYSMATGKTDNPGALLVGSNKK